MHGRYWLGIVLLLCASPVIAAGESSAVKVTVRGVLTRSRDASSDEPLLIRITPVAENESGVLTCRLILPGDAGVRDAVAVAIGELVVIDGELRIHRGASQKDEGRRTECSIRVQTLRLSREERPIIGPTSADGSWYAVRSRNGLRIYNGRTNKGYRIYDPLNPPEASAIDWSATAVFSPNGRYLYTRQGLRNDLWRLPDFQPIPLAASMRDEGLAAMSFSRFSPDGKFVVMRGYGKSKMPDQLICFRTDTGKEVARVRLVNPHAARRILFSPDGSTMVIAHDGAITVLSLTGGAAHPSLRDD